MSGAAEARLVRNLNSLLEVSKALAVELDVDSLLGAILAQAAAVMEAERSSIFIYDGATQTLTNRVSGELAPGRVAIPLGVGIAGHVAKSGEVVNIPDAYADARFNREVDKTTGFRTRAMMCAPLQAHDGALVGVIQVLNKRGGGAFDADDEALLKAFASHAGVALDRAQLVESALERERMEEALRLAHDIQMDMLPKRLPQRPELELSARLHPARSVGGDFYDFLEKGGGFWVAVGDVSGKGVGAALFMAVAKTLFRACVEGERTPADVMARLNRELSRDNERALFVTVFVARLDPSTGELLFCNGGHNPPLLLRANGAVEALRGRAGAALGIIPDAGYETQRAALAPGDTLLLYTDGVTEALDRGEQQYSLERLEACLRQAAGRNAAQLLEAVLADVQAFVAGAESSDDLTLLALRRLRG